MMKIMVKIIRISRVKRQRISAFLTLAIRRCKFMQVSASFDLHTCVQFTFPFATKEELAPTFFKLFKLAQKRRNSTQLIAG